ncbi:hypothetical protein [Kribbella alba]|uniref:hypothetical protein n=1 Tax=Kribbella alba TaxID=190197 RepID=UPI0031DC0E15
MTEVPRPSSVSRGSGRGRSSPDRPLVELFTREISAEGRQHVRESLADRLAMANDFLPTGVRLHVCFRAGELSDRVVALVLRRPLLGLQRDRAHAIYGPAGAAELSSTSPSTTVAYGAH